MQESICDIIVASSLWLTDFQFREQCWRKGFALDHFSQSLKEPPVYLWNEHTILIIHDSSKACKTCQTQIIIGANADRLDRNRFEPTRDGWKVYRNYTTAKRGQMQILNLAPVSTNHSCCSGSWRAPFSLDIEMYTWSYVCWSLWPIFTYNEPKVEDSEWHQ